MKKTPNRRTRRDFLRTASAALAAPYVITTTALGADGRPAASERITMAGIGMGGRGRGDLGGFLRFEEVQVLAVCDVKKGGRDGAKGMVDKRYGNKDCVGYVDFREIIERDDIDTILCATPDHWHAVIGVYAMRSGKDVFCEKPLTLTIKEGRIMVDVARRYGRVFSSGSQRVIGNYGKKAREVQAGTLGQIHKVHVNPGGPPRHCNLPAQDCPPDIDWNLWLGPAPWAPYNSFRCGGAYGLGGKGFRTWYDYSGGMMTDWGGHKFGGAMFALGLDHTGPTEIIPPDGENYQHLTYKFACGIEMDLAKGGPEYEAAKGKVDGLTWEPPKHLLDRDYKGKGGLPGDFLHCVKTRETPFRDVEFAHRVATVCHLGNIALELKRPLKWDPDKEEFIDDNEANRMTWRPMREPWVI